MNKSLMFGALLSCMIAVCSCSSHYHLQEVTRSRLLVSSRLDEHPDIDATRFLEPYKMQVDTLMKPVVGRVAQYMAAQRPESLLSNLLSDILVWGGRDFNEHPDFAVYNMGGMRAALSKGEVTKGDIIDVAPFENKICFLTLPGSKVIELFQQIARVGGEGVSHSVRMIMDKDGKLLDVTIGGKTINPQTEYRIATLDYLAQGNDHLDAFKDKIKVNSPAEESNNVRYLIMKYFKEATARGEIVNSKIEGRIICR